MQTDEMGFNDNMFYILGAGVKKNLIDKQYFGVTVVDDYTDGYCRLLIKVNNDECMITDKIKNTEVGEVVQKFTLLAYDYFNKIPVDSNTTE